MTVIYSFTDRLAETTLRVAAYERHDVPGGSVGVQVSLESAARIIAARMPAADALALVAHIRAAVPPLRFDDCGICDLTPTVTGYVRGVQVSCPVHGEAKR